jgi:hypothetical protein
MKLTHGYMTLSTTVYTNLGLQPPSPHVSSNVICGRNTFMSKIHWGLLFRREKCLSFV